MMKQRGHEATLDYHRRMIDDAHRMDAYDRALRARVRPGDVVLDVGCGTGILAMMAARCGAARVHAVESMPVARLARQLVAANGLADRVIVHEADMTELPPIEPVDVVVSDFMGRMVFDDAMLDAVAAAGRWLKPGGAFIPERLKVMIAPVGGFRMIALEWIESVCHGIDLRPLRTELMCASYGVELAADTVLATPQAYAEIVPPEVPTFLRSHAFTVTRPRRLRALAGWFEATFAPGVTLNTAPGTETHWGQVVFPLPPIPLEVSDEVAIRLRLIEEEDWEAEWQAEVRRGTEVLGRAAFDTRKRPGRRDAPPIATPAGKAEDLNELAKGAYQSGWRAEALEYWEQASRVQPPNDPEAPLLYENLGLGYLVADRPWAAARAFLRALDGDLKSREQSLRMLVLALNAAGQPNDAERAQQVYDSVFGRRES